MSQPEPVPNPNDYRIVHLPGRPEYWLPKNREVLRATLCAFYAEGRRLHRRIQSARATQAST